MTQISVEVVTIILLLLALNFLPNRTPVESGAGTPNERRGHRALSAASRRWGALIYTILMCAISP